ncbi:MAG: nucleotidyltransferase family protein [Chloroflexota bacterium]
MTTGNSLVHEQVAAVVLAAGLSTRMKSPKLLLPWRKTTVIGQVVETLNEAGVDEIVVVSGETRQALLHALSGSPAQVVFNARYAEDAMAVSLQVGLTAVSSLAAAALVVLGDQPQMQVDVVRAILDVYRQTSSTLVVPSYRFRRGHPWLLHRSLWDALRALPPGATLRHFLAAQAVHIRYVSVATDSVLQDLDTPEDYARSG